MTTPFNASDLTHLELYAGAIQVQTTGRPTASLGTHVAHTMAEFLERARRDLEGGRPFFSQRDANELRRLANLLDQGLPAGSWDHHSDEAIGRMALCRDISRSAKRVLRLVEERIR
jgi:hypothetical protein